MTNYILGNGGLARELDSYLGFGCILVGPEDEAATIANRTGDDNFFVGVGGPITRRKIAQSLDGVDVHRVPCLCRGIGGPYLFPPYRGIVIAPGTYLTVGIEIDDFVYINLACTIGHGARIGACSVINPGAHISGDVRIGEGCLIGSGAVILQGIAIGDGAIIGAGAVVTRDVEPGTTVVGVPARRRGDGRMK